MGELLGEVPTKVVNIHRGDAYDVYVGRQGHGLDGYFGNPIQLGGSCFVCGQVHTNRGPLLACFETYARDRVSSDLEYRSRVSGLYGRVLGCFCAPDQCHGDVLAKLAGELQGAT